MDDKKSHPCLQQLIFEISYDPHLNQAFEFLKIKGKEVVQHSVKFLEFRIQLDECHEIEKDRNTEFVIHIESFDGKELGKVFQTITTWLEDDQDQEEYRILKISW